MNRRQFQQSAAMLALSAAVPSLNAQAWPDKPIKFILSQPAGSGPDTMARIIGEQLTRRWGQAVVVENRPGGQNAIGAQAAARAAPDGQTFYFATAAALVSNVYLFKSLPYDPRKDFTPVGMIGKVPFALSVQATSSIKNLADLVAQAKANPGKLTIANEGPKTFGGMMTRLLANQLGIQINAVPYVNVAAGINDTIAGQTEFIMSDVPAVIPMVKAGRIRTVAVTTAKRANSLDSVPTVSETIPGFDYAGWVGIVAPTGTPASIIQRFNRELDAVLNDKDVAARLAAIGPVTEGAGTVEQMSTFLAAEHNRWAKLTQDIGVVPD